MKQKGLLFVTILEGSEPIVPVSISLSAYIDADGAIPCSCHGTIPERTRAFRRKNVLSVQSHWPLTIDVNHFINGFVDEDDSNQSSKALLYRNTMGPSQADKSLTRESSDVLDEITGISDDHDHQSECSPQTDPTAKIHVIVSMSSGKESSILGNVSYRNSLSSFTCRND